MRQFHTIPGKRPFTLELQSQVRTVLNVTVVPVLRLKALILKAWIQDKYAGTKANQCEMPPNYLSSKVQFIHDVRKGRFCLANQSIEAGEVILVEEPIASIVYHPEDLYCHSCAGLLLLALPCPACPDVLFCSLKCLETSLASHHKRECKIRLFGVLKKLAKNVDKVSFGKIIALRLITQKNFLQLEQLQPTDVDETLLPEPEFSDYDFLWSLYALKGSIDHTVVDSLLNLVFNDLPDDPLTPLKEVVRRYSKIVEANSFAIEAPSLNPLQGERLSSFWTIPIEKWQTGSALYLKASLFNHSCDPSAAFVFFNNRIIIAATRKIEPGEEVSISYGPLFYYHDKEHRQLGMNSYDFKCDCEACLGDWPDWTSISTGLVPKSVFSSSKWKPKDLLMETGIRWPLKNPEQFILAVQAVQESEQAAKISSDLVSYRSAMKKRGQLLQVVKPPHFCHLKTRLGVTTGLWYQYWSEYQATG
ncbi:hypothetical protein TCAL_00745 [Tigriopus californicus]|uniref:SET domain-containing protein n=1 Tax=Tigriopus californicus TaxID=6832 RepID=A0A553PCD2_TIGCA|nr:hypothetical protein TCAL_00745 [Tigriopus californicus]